jgi:hypothetical protein
MQALYTKDNEVSMTEYEVIILIVERRLELISVVQWWASISVGIIAGSQVLERFLNIVLLCVLLSFYLFFTLLTYSYSAAIAAQLVAGFMDLSIIGATSAQALVMLEQQSSGIVGDNLLYATFALGVVVVTTCSYPIWVYKRSQVKSA